MTQKENNIDALVAAADALEEALRGYVYETTHLSPEEDDGSHKCWISKQCLDRARTARTEYRAAREAVRKGTPPAFATSA